MSIAERKSVTHVHLSDVDERLKCGICQDVLERPKQCKNGHLFCQDHFSAWLNKKKECPTCQCKMTTKTCSFSFGKGRGNRFAQAGFLPELEYDEDS